MTFSQEVKLELIQNKLLRQNYKYAFAYGLFFYSNAFGPEEVSIRTRQEEVADLFCWLASSLLGKGTTTKQSQIKTSGQPLFRAWLPLPAERQRLVGMLREKAAAFDWDCADNAEEIYAFFGGAFLSCGNITDPTKSYHMEFVVKSGEKKEILEPLLEQYSAGFGATMRRGQHVLYCKEVRQIQDLLAHMGASKATLKMVDVELVKDLRNTVNRQTNCETANISKQVNASTAQVRDIELLAEVGVLDNLPLPQQEAARLRLENPELSLSELVERSPSPVSRSGLHHRLAAISAKAEDIRALQREQQKE